MNKLPIPEQKKQSQSKLINLLQSSQKQNQPKMVKSSFQALTNETIFENNTLVNIRNQSNQSLSRIKSIQDYDKRISFHNANTGIELSLQNYPIQSEKKKLIGTNINIGSEIFQIDTKNPDNLQSQRQQFSFHQAPQDNQSEDDNPEIEPHTLNIYEDIYNTVIKSCKHQENDRSKNRIQ